MATETELKLLASPRAAAQLLRHAWFRRIEHTPPKRERLVSVYYDTRKRALQRRGISLRVRRVGRQYVQTVKAESCGIRGPFAQAEVEAKIDGRRPDLARAKGSPLDHFKRKKLREKLRRAFATEVTRVAVPVLLGASELEVAVDRGIVKTGRHKSAISEIEIELKRGKLGHLVSLARRIAADTRAAYGSASKAERGYALDLDAEALVVGARDIELDPDATAGEAFQVIALSCLDQIDRNREAVERGSLEGLHQMRIGLRRLRAAISMFKLLFQDAESAAVKAELKWLRNELGPARDLDVLIRESVEPLQKERVDGAALRALRADMAKRRQRSFDRVKITVAGERYRKAILAAALWIVGGSWAATTDPKLAAERTRPVADFIDHKLGHRHDKIVKRLKNLEQLDPRSRHKLRIAVKKLRYADEFFGSLYRGGRAKRRLKHHRAVLQKLQSVLGKLNDIHVHGEMARALVRPAHRVKKKTEKSFAMGLISGEDHARVASLTASAEKARHRLEGERLPSLR